LTEKDEKVAENKIQVVKMNKQEFENTVGKIKISTNQIKFAQKKDSQ